MSNYMQKVLEQLGQHQLTVVPIDNIRCVETRVPVEEGWGGRSIEHFPPYGFFKRYFEGEQSAARKDMHDWYYRRIVEHGYMQRPKSEGGMAGGSFYKELVELHRTGNIALSPALSNVDEGILHEAIERKVNYRLATFDSIKERGFVFSWDFIRLIPKDGVFYLRGGHHRVAALAICGESAVSACVAESIYMKILRQTAARLPG